MVPAAMPSTSMGGSSSKTVAWFHENQGEITDLAEDTQAMRNMIATYVNSLQATITAQQELSSGFAS